MSVSLLEDTRATHQDFDRLTSHLTSILIPGTSKVHRDRLVQEHRASYIVDLLTRRAGSLVDAYEDKTGERAKEVERISGRDVDGSGEAPPPGAEMTEFYQRLGRLKEYHRKYPGQMAEEPELDWSGLEGDPNDERDFVDRMFTGEEVLGRYLDLHALHDAYNNLSTGNATVKRLTYTPYIEQFDKFDGIPKVLKSRPQYEKYLHDLRDYLAGFLRRTRPLFDLDDALSKAKADFAKAWEADKVPGWSTTVNGDATEAGIWCPACQRSYAKQTVYDAHLTSKKHLKAAERLQSAASANGAGDESVGQRRLRERPIALLEAHVATLGSLLNQIRRDTKANVERRAALTDKERQQELDEWEMREAKERAEAEKAALQAEKIAAGDVEGAIADEDDEDDARIYNPRKFPLGWDGKPIPYWLYKLHGLGVEYRCEICSDYVYMGRKNFERHFQESRHAFGMRALGLPNIKHFHEITRIEDAFALAEKLKSQGRSEAIQEETMEEMEDADGNVYNRKTYEDLKRQGLL